MTDDFNIPIQQYRLATMLEDRSVRVDLKGDSRSENIHYAPFFQVIKPDHPAYKKLLEATGLNKPGDVYSYNEHQDK